MENAVMPKGTVDSVDGRKSGDGSPRVLAVSSSGGHWTQLMRLRPAFEQAQVTYVTTFRGCEAMVAPASLLVVDDAHLRAPGCNPGIFTMENVKTKIGIARLALQISQILMRVRPHVVISTGAAPGYLAVRLGKLFGARTVWVDSIANMEELSLSGRKIGKYADLWLTQWPHLARQNGPSYIGAVL